MPRAGFYNDNEYREYPFTTKVNDALPTDLIVDCGFIMGVDSGFDQATDCVYLYEVRKTATQLAIEFRTTAVGAAATGLVFTRNFNAEEWTTEFKASPSAATTCAAEPVWEGFVVSGVVSTTAALLPTGGSLNFVTASSSSSSSSSLGSGASYTFTRKIEPGRVQSLVGSYLRSVSVANYSRVVMNPCEVSPLTLPASTIVTNATCLKGNIKLRPGVNCQILQNNVARRLTIAASLGINADDPEAFKICSEGGEIRLSSTDANPLLKPGRYNGSSSSSTAPEYSKFLSGGPACDQVISGINGLGAPNVKIVGGAGIQITADQLNPNTIQLNVADNLLTANC
jgi:hypothetical protein